MSDTSSLWGELDSDIETIWSAGRGSIAASVTTDEIDAIIAGFNADLELEEATLAAEVTLAEETVFAPVLLPLTAAAFVGYELYSWLKPKDKPTRGLDNQPAGHVLPIWPESHESAVAWQPNAPMEPVFPARRQLLVQQRPGRRR